MTRLLVLAHPLAGDGRAARLAAGADALSGPFTVQRADSPAALREAAGGAPAVAVVVGGDGSLHRALPDLLESGLPVALLPGGTVNDLAHALGMSGGWPALAEAVAAGRTEAVPLLEVNGRPFAVYGVLGVGQESGAAVARTRRSLRALRRRLPGAHLPLMTALTVLLSRGYRRSLRLRWDGGEMERRTPGVYVANRPHLDRDIDLEWDRGAGGGRFLVIVLRDVGRPRLLGVLRRLFGRRRLSAVAAEVEVFEAGHLVLESLDGRPLRFSADGEPAAEAARLEIRPAPRPLVAFRGAGPG